MAPHPGWYAEALARPSLSFAVTAWKRAEEVEGTWYDEALAERVVSAWPIYFRHTEGEWAGKPFVLSIEQAAIVRLLIGWKNADGSRLFRRLLLWVARKNGKTEFLAALSLMFWLFDGEKGGQAFAFAKNEAQAKLVFEKARRMIELSDVLRKRVERFKKSFYCPELWAKFEVLSGQAEGKHGLSASVIVGDEMHEWPDEWLYSTLHQSTGARRQPIELLASTAGLRNKGYGWELWEESQSILAGKISDATTLVVIFAADPEDDWTDESVWQKANPNLGISPKLAYLRAERDRGLDNPRAEANFRRYHLNQWVSSESRWFPVERWDRCASAPDAWRSMEAKLRGRSCYGGLDLSKSKDITALVWMFPPIDDEKVVTLLCRFWVPEDTLMERVRRDRVKYDVWQKIGALRTTPGDWVDQEAIKQDVLADAAVFDVKALGYDPWGGTKLAQELLGEGAPMMEVRQGIPTLGEPSAAFEKKVYARTYDHGGHPVLRWMIENVTLFVDRNGNFKPDKAKSTEKIDGVVAAIMAEAVSSAEAERQPEYQMIFA